jgi:hypothetical protein
MEIAIVVACAVLAGGPLIGIWQGHVWAKANGKVLRTAAAPEHKLTA